MNAKARCKRLLALCRESGERREVVGETAKTGDFDGNETCHQFATAHSWEPGEAAVGLLSLVEALQGAANTAVEEVLVEEIDELSTTFRVTVGFAQPGSLVKDELLEVVVLREGAFAGGRTAGHRASRGTTCGRARLLLP